MTSAQQVTLTLTPEQHNRIVTLCGSHRDLVQCLNQTALYTPATGEQLDAARREYANDDVNVDDNAGISNPEDGSGYWVQAWVWVATPENA